MTDDEWLQHRKQVLAARKEPGAFSPSAPNGGRPAKSEYANNADYQQMRRININRKIGIGL